ncbi:hypothetical protein J1614_005613 [Plenodomus biglobosus]|nr:hypothetical protein J1614_005613 [Plenodomus biglobosus]
MDSLPQARGRGRGQGQGRGRNRGTNTDTNTPLIAHSRGRGRGRAHTHTHNHNHNHSQPFHSMPPPHHALHPSTPVSIILKADQQSGHLSHGIIRDILTRGNHPRGVKVRLRDGRVGRVQAVVSVGEGERGEAGVGWREGEGDGQGVPGLGRRGGEGGGFRGERDCREDEGEYLFDEERARGRGRLDLFAAVEDAERGIVRGKARGKGRGRGRGGGGGGGGGGVAPAAAQIHDGSSEVAVCPVCGDFEGDETAVAHHVEEHFGS